jgi:branched-chain amino acid transport system substrate-binding protein
MMFKLKYFRLLGISIILALVLAACRGSGDEPAAQEDGAATATPGTSAEEEAAGEFAGTIVLGAAVSETGIFAREGKDTRQGYNLWVDWVNNEHGGIKVGDERYRVEIIMYDVGLQSGRNGYYCWA